MLPPRAYKKQGGYFVRAWFPAELSKNKRIRNNPNQVELAEVGVLPLDCGEVVEPYRSATFG
jgi:hypothetical protein